MKKLAFILLFVLVSAAFAEPLSYDDPTLWAWQGEGDHPIDLFLICPTVDIGEDGNANMDVTDEKLREHFMSALMQEKGLYDQTCRCTRPTTGRRPFRPTRARTTRRPPLTLPMQTSARRLSTT